MTTMIVEVQNGGDAGKIAAAVRQIKGVAKVKIEEMKARPPVETDKQEYEQLKSAFLNGSKRSMSQHINKFIE